MPQQDEFDQYKVKSNDDEFSQYKVQPPSATTAPPPKPGLLSRYSEGSGIPTSMKGLSEFGDQLSQFDPVKAGMALGEQFKGAVKRGAKEVGEAVQNVREGGPVGANLKKAAYGATVGALQSNPITQPIETLSRDYAAGNYPAAAGDFLASLTQYYTMKGPLKGKARMNKIASAAGGAGGETSAALKSVLPEIDKTVAAAGKPSMRMTIGDFQDAVKATQSRLTAQFNGALYRNAHKMVDTSPISKALLDKAAEMPPTAEGRAVAKELTDAAQEYKNPWTLRDLNKERVYSNAQSQSLYNKSGSGQMGAMRSNVEMMKDKIIADGSRMVYDELGKYDKSVDWAKLKNQQHHLINLQDQLEKQVGNLADKQAVESGRSLLEKGSVGFSAHGGGLTGRFSEGLHNLMPGLGPESAANAKIRAAYPSGVREAVKKSVLALPLTRLHEAVPPPPKASTDQEGP